MARTRRSKGGAKRTVKGTVRRTRTAAPRTGAGGDLLKAVQGLVKALPVDELEKRLVGLEKSVEKLDSELRKALSQVAAKVRGGPAKRAPAKRRTAKRAPGAKRTVKRAPAAKRTVKRAPAAKRTVKRTVAKRTVKRTVAKRAPAVKRTVVKRTVAKRAAPRRTVKRTPPPSAPSAPAAPLAP